VFFCFVCDLFLFEFSGVDFALGSVGPRWPDGGSHPRPVTLYVEYAGRGNEYSIIFIFQLFCEYIHLESVYIHVIYRVNQAEYGIHIRVIAPQDYVNILSTRRPVTPLCVN